MVFVIATLRINPDHKEQLLKDAVKVIAGTKKEPGCIRYELTQSLERDDQLIFVEEWESRDHLAAHFETPHMAEWRKACATALVSRRVQIIHAEQVETRT